MPYGIVLTKGLAGRMEDTYEFLMKMRGKGILEEKMKKKKKTEYRAKIEEVFLTMGWPDIILIIEAKQILDIQEAITYIKEELKKKDMDFIDTSTIICVTKREQEKIWEELAEYVAKKFDFWSEGFNSFK